MKFCELFQPASTSLDFAIPCLQESYRNNSSNSATLCWAFTYLHHYVLLIFSIIAINHKHIPSCFLGSSGPNAPFADKARTLYCHCRNFGSNYRSPLSRWKNLCLNASSAEILSAGWKRSIRLSSETKILRYAKEKRGGDSASLKAGGCERRCSNASLWNSRGGRGIKDWYSRHSLGWSHSSSLRYSSGSSLKRERIWTRSMYEEPLAVPPIVVPWQDARAVRSEICAR